MEGEISNYIKVWLQVIISLWYCYAIGKIIPKGFHRLLAITPILCLFLTLPLAIHSLHLVGTFAFFISWLANFKLALFAFGKGPLSHPSLSLKQFVVVASFPIKISDQESPMKKTLNKIHKSLWSYTIKGLVFVGLITSHKYIDYNMYPMVLLYNLYCLHMYLILEVILGVFATLARTLLGVELEPHFDKPYLASSLQNFWGRRWNLVAVRILRPTIYEPAEQLAVHFVGPKQACFPAIFLTFLVSGLVHELIFYYLLRVRPTWEITWFFILHGFCVLLEVFLKKTLASKFQLPSLVSGPLTIGFIMGTACWLFFPQLLQCNSYQRALQEYAELGAFPKNAPRTLKLGFNALMSST